MASYNTNWFLTIIQPFLQGLVSFVANLLLAIVVFIIGYLISVGIGKIITEILKSIKFNKLFEKEGWTKALQRARVEVNPSEFIGAVFKWIFVIISLLVAVDVLKLTKFAEFLRDVLNYLPNVIVAVLIFVVAVIISDIVEKLVRVAVERMKMGYGYLAALIVKWAIWVFTIFLILDQLLPASLLIKTLYTSIVYGAVSALALGVGLAIGLGGKDLAAGILEDMKRKIKER
ncbi:MAG: small-conductance mechanosensitive ion channel [Parcubacteria group bacterium Licking1014_1]|nr:MAG: small-conductance mechanosensitive ion channel [Parcubacteria group bacterium Licking1014_1]